MKNCLNLGCGTKYIESTEHENWTNVDIDPQVKTDWCGDACHMPDTTYHGRMGRPYTNDWDNFFDHIYSHHSLEHFDCLFTIVDEMARVSRDQATWEIITPYATWSPGWANPHHKLLFDERTFRFFDKGKNGIHKRRDQNYSIETVSVEYGWNRMHCHDICVNVYQDKHLDYMFLKDKYLNVVKQITFHLKVSK